MSQWDFLSLVANSSIHSLSKTSLKKFVQLLLDVSSALSHDQYAHLQFSILIARALLWLSEVLRSVQCVLTPPHFNGFWDHWANLCFVPTSLSFCLALADTVQLTFAFGWISLRNLVFLFQISIRYPLSIWSHWLIFWQVHLFLTYLQDKGLQAELNFWEPLCL